MSRLSPQRRRQRSPNCYSDPATRSHRQPPPMTFSARSISAVAAQGPFASFVKLHLHRSDHSALFEVWARRHEPALDANPC